MTRRSTNRRTELPLTPLDTPEIDTMLSLALGIGTQNTTGDWLEVYEPQD